MPFAGIFVALVLRMDAANNFRSNYFLSAFVGYALGLGSTIVVMNVFNAAQVCVNLGCKLVSLIRDASLGLPLGSVTVCGMRAWA